MLRPHGHINHTASKGCSCNWRDLERVTKEFAEKAEKGSMRFWVRRKDKCEGKKNTINP